MYSLDDRREENDMNLNQLKYESAVSGIDITYGDLEPHEETDQSVDALGNPRDHYITLPALYWIDHTESDNAGGQLRRWSGQQIDSNGIKAPGRRVLVRVSVPEIEELFSRASYYADGLNGEDYRENRQACDSAKRTLVAIERWFAKNPGEIELENLKIHGPLRHHLSSFRIK